MPMETLGACFLDAPQYQRFKFENKTFELEIRRGHLHSKITNASILEIGGRAVYTNTA